MKLSYIITFHNGGKYISECIESLYRQGLEESEFEVILVDDKSDDSESLAIIEKYRKYPNYQIIHNAVNQRQGESRNVGLRVAKGEYVWFIDQDDYIVDSCAGRLFDISMSKELDILIFSYDFKYEGVYRRSIMSQQLSNSSDTVRTGLNYLEYVCDGNISTACAVYAWNKLFRRSFLTENGLLFPHFEAEDDYFTLYSILAAGSVCSINKKFIVHRIHDNSFMSGANGKGYVICDWTLVWGAWCSDFLSKVPGEYPKTRNNLLRTIDFRANSISVVPRLPRIERRFFYNRFDEYRSQILRVESFFRFRTRFILRHKMMVINFPLAVRVRFKVNKILNI